MIVYEELNLDDELTEEQIAMLKKMEASPAVPDEDCPEVTEEQLKFARVVRGKRQSQIKRKLPE